MGCPDQGTCCLILPLLSSQIYQAYNDRSPIFAGTLSDVLTPINNCLTQLYQTIKCYQPINCEGLDTVLLQAVNDYLSTNGGPVPLLAYQTTVQTTCNAVLTFQPIE